jgi:6-phosphogluconolactonase (cycloisomerase 2 family)
MKLAKRLLRICGGLSTIILLALLAGCGSSSNTKACFGNCCTSNCTAPGEFLYATGGDGGNVITSFSLSAAGVPTSLGSQAGPNQSVGIVVDPSGRFLYVSDFLNDSVDAFSITATTGALTQITGSPFSAGPAPGGGGLAITPDANFLYVTLLNSNAVAGFSISGGALAALPSSPFPAESPVFQAVVDPSGTFLYATNHNDSMGGISAYTINPTTGDLTAVAGSPFPTEANFPGPNGLAIGGEGKFLYVGMVGTSQPNNVVFAFAITPGTGVLTPVVGSPFTTGSEPIRVATDPSGKFLFTANQSDSNVSAFTIDSATGILTPVTGSPFGVQGSPASLEVDPSGTFLFVATTATNGLSAFSIDSNSGALSPVAGSPFGTGGGISGVAIAKPQ